MQQQRGIPIHPNVNYLQTFGGRKSSKGFSERSLNRLMDQAQLSDRFSFGNNDENLLNTMQTLPEDLGESLKRF